MSSDNYIFTYLFHYGCTSSLFNCLKEHRLEEYGSLPKLPIILTEGLIQCLSIDLSGQESLHHM